MTTAADYINEYIARRAPIHMVKPWRHENPLIAALWWKQERWEQAAKLEDCAKPSTEWDEAFDAYTDAGSKYEAIITDAWSSRKLERLSIPRQLGVPVGADEARLNEAAA